MDNLTAHMPADDLVQLIQPLDKSTRPEKQEDLILYGEAEVHLIAKLLGERSREAVEDYRDFKHGRKEGDTLKRLIIASKTYRAWRRDVTALVPRWLMGKIAIL